MTYSPLERMVLRMAWEGCWFAVWEVLWAVEDEFIPGLPSDLDTDERQTLAKDTIAGFVDAGMIKLYRFRYTVGCTELEDQAPNKVLADPQTWRAVEIDSWHIRFAATKAGIKAFEALSAIERRPPSKLKPIGEEPSLEWVIEHVTKYVDGSQNVYEFWRPVPAIWRFYRDFPEDPADRLCYFWRQVFGYGKSLIRFREEDGERHFRAYLEHWTNALRLTDEEWQSLVRVQRRPLDQLGDDWSIFEPPKGTGAQSN